MAMPWTAGCGEPVPSGWLPGPAAGAGEVPGEAGAQWNSAGHLALIADHSGCCGTQWALEMLSVADFLDPRLNLSLFTTELPCSRLNLPSFTTELVLVQRGHRVG